MRIAIHIGPVRNSHSMRGIGVYTKLLLDALHAHPLGNDFVQFGGVEEMPEHCDVVHYPFFDPFFLTLPLKKKKPTVVTVHDLIPLVFPDRFPPGIRGKIKWNIQRLSLLGAKRIITDSVSSKNDIAKITGYQSDQIDVVYLAQSPAFHPVKEKKIRESVLQSHGIPERFVLYVGDVNWNKNVEGLLEGFSLFHERHPETSLVLVGKAFVREPDIPEIKTIQGKIQALKLKHHVCMPGFVSDHDLSCLYSSALCLVVPSWYEGFGLPVLEAFACGCPVIAAHNSSLSEISGPAFLCEAGEVSSIAEALSDMAGYPDQKRKALIEKGFDWVKKFTWERVASETIAAYEKVVA